MNKNNKKFNIKFCGDRKSKLMNFGWFIRKHISKKLVELEGWDGYPSRIEIRYKNHIKTFRFN